MHAKNMHAKEVDPNGGLPLELDRSTQDLNLKQLYYFHAVATEGSISRAARKLGLSQATISEQVKNLEQYLSTTLAERKPNGLQLNAQGRRVYEHTKQMFRSVRRLLSELSPDRANDRWVLEIGICPTISRTFALQRFLPLFALDNISPRIRQGSYDHLMEKLLQGELDIVLSENQPTEADSVKVGTEVLLQHPLVFVAAPELARSMTHFPEALAQMPFIQYTVDSSYRWEVQSFFADNELTPNIVGEADDVTILAMAAIAGRCVVAVPQGVVKEQLESGELVMLGQLQRAYSRVYAYFQSVKTPEAVQRALGVLSGGAIEPMLDEQEANHYTNGADSTPGAEHSIAGI